MEIHLHPDLEAKLNRVAAENNRGAEEYVQQLVEHYVDHDAWFRQEVKKGLDQLGRGESLTDKEVGARIEREHSAPPPTVASLLSMTRWWTASSKCSARR